MKSRLLFAVMVLMVLFPVLVWAQEAVKATTDDGRAVVLSPDGTWKFVDQEKKEAAVADNKPASATKVFQSGKGFYELWYDPKEWFPEANEDNSEAEFMLRHKSGDAYAMFIAERITMPLETLLDLALNNAKNAAPDAKILFKKNIKVNGVDVVNMKMDGTLSGIPFSYWGYYWSGKPGALQAITFTGQNLFEEYAPAFRELLSGLVIRP